MYMDSAIINPLKDKLTKKQKSSHYLLLMLRESQVNFHSPQDILALQSKTDLS